MVRAVTQNIPNPIPPPLLLACVGGGAWEQGWNSPGVGRAALVRSERQTRWGGSRRWGSWECTPVCSPRPRRTAPWMKYIHKMLQHTHSNSVPPLRPCTLVSMATRPHTLVSMGAALVAKGTRLGAHGNKATFPGTYTAAGSPLLPGPLLASVGDPATLKENRDIKSKRQAYALLPPSLPSLPFLPPSLPPPSLPSPCSEPGFTSTS